MLRNRIPNSRSRRAVMTAGIVAFVGTGWVSTTVGGAAPGQTSTGSEPAITRQTVIESATSGTYPAVSGDGRRIVFVAPASLVPTGLTDAPDGVWLRDREAGSLVELTVPGEGLRPGASRHPAISRDGCTVAIVTELAFDLFRDDDQGQRWDVYRTVLPGCAGVSEAGEWQLVSTTATGEPVARGDVAADQRPAVAGSGSIIVYARQAVPGGGDLARYTSLDAVDLTIPLGDPGRVTSAPGLPVDLPGSELAPVGQRDPSISDDGRFISMTTDALITDELNADTGEEAITGTWPATPAGTVTRPDSQVYRWDRTVGADNGELTFHLVSANPAGEPSAGSSGSSSISSLGNVVAFVSTDPDLDQTTTGFPRPAEFQRGLGQVYVADLSPEAPTVAPGEPLASIPERVVTMASRTAETIGNGASQSPALDGDGHAVAFLTAADNLVSLAPRVSPDGGGDLLISNLVDGSLERVTVRPDGSAADPGALSPQLSTSGRSVLFASATAGQLTSDEVRPGSQVVRVERFPQLEVTPVDVGTVALGIQSQEWRTAVINRGPGAFIPDSITTNDPAFAITGGTCFAGAPIPAGGSCELRVVFTPVADGPASSAITLQETGYAAMSATVLFSGVGGVPTLVADPSGQSLGTAVVGSRGATIGSVSVVNVGPFDEHIVSVSVSGANSSDFPVQKNGCAGAVITPGQSCQLGVGFAPSADGQRNAIVTFVSEGGATTSAVVYGDGEYRPGIAVGVSTIRSGDSVVVGGLGFPGSSTLSVWWSGSDQQISVATSRDGAFSVRVPVLPGSATGPRRIVVIDPSGRHAPVESDSILVQGSQRPRRRP